VVKVKRIPRKKRNSAAGNRLTVIETSLSEMESQINQTKETMDKIEMMLAQLNQSQPKQSVQKIRQQSSEERQRRPLSLFPVLKRRNDMEKREELKKGIDTKSFDVAGLMELLQNPAVQALIKKGLNSGVATKGTATRNQNTKMAKNRGKNNGKKEALSDMVGGMDLAQIAKLLQNPMVQSMIKNMF
jgi:hypothetical protein